jgi:hypothetical protein
MLAMDILDSEEEHNSQWPPSSYYSRLQKIMKIPMVFLLRVFLFAMDLSICYIYMYDKDSPSMLLIWSFWK